MWALNSAAGYHVELVWNHWQLVAWIAPLAWAVSSIVDVVLVDRGYYRDAVDGTIISAAFGAAPCIVIALAMGDPEPIELSTATMAFAAGLAFAVHLHAYFKALFTLNDAAHADTAFNANVAVVPVLAYILLEERLSGPHYAGIALAGLGVIILMKSAKGTTPLRKEATRPLIVGIFSLSLSLVLLEAVFQHCGYWQGLFWCSAGWLSYAAMVWASTRRRGIVSIVQKYAGVFAANELVGAIAVIGTLRATDLSPSVSLIPVIEASTPILILGLSLSCITLLRLFPTEVRERYHSALCEQLSTAPRKLLAMGFILAGVYVVAQPPELERLAEILASSALAFESVRP